MLRIFLISTILMQSTIFIHAQTHSNSQIKNAKEAIVSSLSQTLKGSSHSKPVLILIGGYIGSGKTTLSKALQEKYEMTIFSLNAIRQAMLDEGIDIRTNKQEERRILFEIYPQLLATCVANLQHIVIDANANRQGIQEAIKFLQENPGGSAYKVVKIHLRASETELYKRVQARILRADLHQGTEADLAYELQSPAKMIYPEDYDLVVDTQTTLFNEEIEIVYRYLQPYFEKPVSQEN